MSYRVSFENEGKGVLFTWEGTICGSELLTANEFINTHDQMQQICYQIWNFTAAERFEVSDEHLRTLAIQNSIAAQRNPAQIMALVGYREFFKGDDRRYMIYAEVWKGYPVQTFPTLQEARRWVASVYPEL